MHASREKSLYTIAMVVMPSSRFIELFRRFVVWIFTPSPNPLKNRKPHPLISKKSQRPRPLLMPRCAGL